MIKRIPFCEDEFSRCGYVPRCNSFYFSTMILGLRPEIARFSCMVIPFPSCKDQQLKISEKTLFLPNNRFAKSIRL